MKPAPKLLLGNLVLGVLSAIALFLQYLALADIAREPDASLEWWIVRISMLVIGVFVLLTMITLAYMIRRTVYPSHGAQKEEAP